MVSLGLYYESSGKPATLSTTELFTDKQTKPWANAQRPTPDRCERSSSSQIARLTPHKSLPDFLKREQEYYSNSICQWKYTLR